MLSTSPPHTQMSGEYLRAGLEQTNVLMHMTSAIREIPDHQEVYLDAQGYSNVIVEILERVGRDRAPTDEDALKYHLHDIVSTETDETKFWGGAVAHLTKMP